MSAAAGTQGSLVVRVDPENIDEFLAKPCVQPFVMDGRPMEGRVRVDADGVRTKRQLDRWVELARQGSIPARCSRFARLPEASAYEPKRPHLGLGAYSDSPAASRASV
jgi:hypothetical protein